VFRGAFLLRNQQSIKGNTILIDEPEISLHPKWQAKIFEYYRKLFTDEKNKQNSQLFETVSSFV
jgi:predicted ATP-dependent endonuclease of OLD family